MSNEPSPLAVRLYAAMNEVSHERAVGYFKMYNGLTWGWTRLEAEAQRAIDEARKEGWQPIETAPRGVKVIAGYYNVLGNWRTILACYYPRGFLEWDETSYGSDDEDGYAPEGWYEESESHGENLRPPECELVFWMPLPKPPNPRDAR